MSDRMLPPPFAPHLPHPLLCAAPEGLRGPGPDREGPRATQPVLAKVRGQGWGLDVERGSFGLVRKDIHLYLTDVQPLLSPLLL